MAKKEKEKKEIVIPKDICEKVLYLDCRIEENIRSLEKALMKLPFVKTKEHLTTDHLEALVKRIERKYMIHLAYIQRNVIDCEDHYSGMIKTDNTLGGRWLKTVYAQTTWETFAKVLFYMYYYIKSEQKKISKIK